MASWLEGRKTIIAGFLVAVIGFLGALGVKLPFDVSTVTADVVVGVLGVVVIIARMFAKTPGALAPKE